MPRWVKLSLIALAAFWVLSQPANAAQTAGVAANKVGDAASSVVTFLSAVAAQFK